MTTERPATQPAWSASASKNHGDGARELEKACELNPNDATWQSSLGKIYREKKEYGKAIPHLEKAVMLDPKTWQDVLGVMMAVRSAHGWN